MIIEFDNDGKIFHVVSDPVPDGLLAIMRDHGMQVIEVKPNKVFDEAGEHIRTDRLEIDMARHFVLDGEVRERTEFGLPVDLNLTASTTFHLPIGTRVSLDGETFLLEDGSITLEPEMVADYSLLFEAPGYVTHTMVVQVNETASS